MSTTVTFAGNLAEDPELGYTHEGNKPFVSFRVMVNHRYQNAQGEWRSTTHAAQRQGLRGRGHQR